MLCKQGVTGSIPVTSTNLIQELGRVNRRLFVTGLPSAYSPHSSREKGPLRKPHRPSEPSVILLENSCSVEATLRYLNCCPPNNGLRTVPKCFQT